MRYGLCCAALLGCSQPVESADIARPSCSQPVSTSSGHVLGEERDGVCAFTAVRYAAAPVGDGRFRAPRPFSSDAITDARKGGRACSQLAPLGQVAGNEDCLTLSVWVPRSTDGAREHKPELPVLVFFHGGGNVADSSYNPKYDGAKLAKATGIIVVTVEFRLGALGYLAHPALGAANPNQASGNYGLWDQIAALSWLQSNLSQFGGDANRVTLLGQSGGARNICALLVAKAASGLFQGAIMSSGACNIRTLRKAEAYGHSVAQALGCDAVEDPAACLRGLPFEQIVTTLPSVPDPMTASAFNPNVDGWVLQGPPLERMMSGARLPVPVIVGSNADEAAGELPRVQTATEYRVVLSALFGGQAAPSIEQRYPVSEYGTAYAALSAAVADARYTCAARQTLTTLARTHAAPVFQYFFAHRPESGPLGAVGAVHGIEHMYLFENFREFSYEPSSREIEFAEALQAYVAAFVSDGAPNPPGHVAWPEFDLSERAYLKFDAEMSTEQDLRGAQCDFWDDFSPD